MLAGIAKFYVEGGTFMHPITLMSVISIAIMIERCYALYFKYNINADQFMAQIQKLVMANNIDRAIKLCNAAPKAALPRVIKAALTRANKGEVEISNAIEEATLEVLPQLNKRTPLLTTVSGMATMLGLLGTIIGLIDAFAAVATAPPDKKTEMLTLSIAIAMNTTAWGLIVAIPTTFVAVLLNTTTKKIVEDIDLYSVKMQNLLVARGKGTTNPLDH